MLKNAEDDLIKKAKESVEDKEVEEIHGVTARLKFTRFFLQVLVTVEPKPVSFIFGLKTLFTEFLQ